MIKDTNQKFAAIDIGSNAMRPIVANLIDGKLQVLERDREAIRLGTEVFTSGILSSQTISRSVIALKRFKQTIDANNVNSYRAIGTSALREAKNKQDFVNAVKQEADLDVNVIDGEEEARLVYLAVSETSGFSPYLDLLIDLGGGSAEITLCKAGDILYSESLQIGAVRLMQLFNAENRTPKNFARLVRAYSRILRSKIQEEIGEQTVSRCIGTGGNLETFLSLKEKFFSKKEKFIMRDELEDILDKLLELDVNKRIEKYGLRNDRADVIVPAAIVILQVLRASNVNKLEVPGVGVREGVIYQLAQGDPEDDPHFQRKRLIQAALQIGKKFKFDQSHAKNVAKLSLDIFEQTQSLHKLSEEGKKLLEIAALLHDIGHFISSRGHHKHSFYLIESSSFPGLTKKEKLIIGCIARYHRKKFPASSHTGYNDLSSNDQQTVSKLAAILRLADGLDQDHTQQVQSLKIELDSDKNCAKIILSEGSELDSWSGKLKSDLFFHVYNVTVDIGSI